MGSSGIRSWPCCAQAVPGCGVLCHLECTPMRSPTPSLPWQGCFLWNISKELLQESSLLPQRSCSVSSHPHHFNPKSWTGIYPEYPIPASCWELGSLGFPLQHWGQEIFKYWGKHKYMALCVIEPNVLTASKASVLVSLCYKCSHARKEHLAELSVLCVPLFSLHSLYFSPLPFFFLRFYFSSIAIQIFHLPRAYLFVWMTNLLFLWKCEFLSCWSKSLHW